jgi:hypothetical protein
MILNELLSPTPDEYRTDKEDNSVLNLHDTRKRHELRLTLDKINRLRIMNDARKVEHEKKLEKVADQYKMPAAQPGL